MARLPRPLSTGRRRAGTVGVLHLTGDARGANSRRHECDRGVHDSIYTEDNLAVVPLLSAQQLPHGGETTALVPSGQPPGHGGPTTPGPAVRDLHGSDLPRPRYRHSVTPPKSTRKPWPTGMHANPDTGVRETQRRFEPSPLPSPPTRPQHVCAFPPEVASPPRRTRRCRSMGRGGRRAQTR